MRRSVLVFVVALVATTIANADIVTVSPNGLYTADVHIGLNGGVSITGPHGTEDFLSQELFGLGGAISFPLVNNFGQVVGTSDGGSDDPAIYFALYGSGGGTGNFSTGNGSGYQGAIPSGVGFGSLGWPDEGCNVRFSCAFENGEPINLKLTDSGVVTAEIYLAADVPPDPQQWFLPNKTTPELSSALLLLTGLVGVSLQRLLFRRGSTKWKE